MGSQLNRKNINAAGVPLPVSSGVNAVEALADQIEGKGEDAAG
jgi:hypothetical protein